MKPQYSLTPILLVITSLMFSGCGGAAAPGAPNCGKGVCVKVGVAEPVRLGEPINVTITVEPERDIPDLGISLDFDHPYTDVVLEGPREWTVAAKARQPITVISTARLKREGQWLVIGRATTPQRLLAMDSVNIYLTRTGGVVNPTVEQRLTPGPPSPVLTVPPTVVVPTPLYPVGCNQHVCVRLQLVEPIRLNEPTTLSVIVEPKEDIPDLFIVLFPSSGVLVEGEREWTRAARAGQAVTVKTTVRFPDEASYWMLAVGGDRSKGRVSKELRVHVTRAGGVVLPSEAPTPTRSPYP